MHTELLMTKKELLAFTPTEGRCVLVHTNTWPGYWARSTSGAEAVKALRGEGARKGTEVCVYDAPAKSSLDMMGGFQFFPPEGKTWREMTQEEAEAWKPQELGTLKL